MVTFCPAGNVLEAEITLPARSLAADVAGMHPDPNGPRDQVFIPVTELNFIFNRAVPCEVRELNFSKAYGYGRKVRVVHSQEQWIQTNVIGGKRVSSPQTSNWWWMFCIQLEGMGRG